VRIPLIYRLEFPKTLLDYVMNPFGRVKAMDLVVFDAAGEDLADPTLVEQFYRYVEARRDSFLFLIRFSSPACAVA